MHFFRYFGKELFMLILACVEDLVHESSLQQLLSGDTLAHDQRLIRFADTQALHKRMACTTFRDESERSEGREEEGMRRAINEIGVRNKGGGETYDGAVQRGDQDFRMGVEGIRHLDIVGYEIPQALAAHVGTIGEGAADGDVGAGGEVAACARQDGDEDVVEFGYLAQQECETVVEILGQSAEFVGDVDSDVGDLAVGVQGDTRV